MTGRADWSTWPTRGYPTVAAAATALVCFSGLAQCAKLRFSQHNNAAVGVSRGLVVFALLAAAAHRTTRHGWPIAAAANGRIVLVAQYRCTPRLATQVAAPCWLLITATAHRTIVTDLFTRPRASTEDACVLRLGTAGLAAGAAVRHPPCNSTAVSTAAAGFVATGVALVAVAADRAVSVAGVHSAYAPAATARLGHFGAAALVTDATTVDVNPQRALAAAT